MGQNGLLPCFGTCLLLCLSVRSLRGSGFFFVKGHGVPKEMLEQMFQFSKEYYLTQDYETEKKPYTMGKDVGGVHRSRDFSLSTLLTSTQPLFIGTAHWLRRRWWPDFGPFGNLGQQGALQLCQIRTATSFGHP